MDGLLRKGNDLRKSSEDDDEEYRLGYRGLLDRDKRPYLVLLLPSGFISKARLLLLFLQLAVRSSYDPRNCSPRPIIPSLTILKWYGMSSGGRS
jgi:hypothetical protein